MDGRLSAVLILAASFLVVVALLWLGWRAKSRAQAHLPAPLPVDEAAFGAPEAAWDDVHYVATTPFDAPLERLVGSGLGFRGRCRLELGRPGLKVALNGRDAFLIPISSIASIERGTATIDRAVERGGLTVVRWNLAAHECREELVDTSFRVVDAGERADLVRRLELALDARAQTPDTQEQLP